MDDRGVVTVALLALEGGHSFVLNEKHLFTMKDSLQSTEDLLCALCVQRIAPSELVAALLDVGGLPLDALHEAGHVTLEIAVHLECAAHVAPQILHVVVSQRDVDALEHNRPQLSMTTYTPRPPQRKCCGDAAERRPQFNVTTLPCADCGAAPIYRRTYRNVQTQRDCITLDVGLCDVACYHLGEGTEAPQPRCLWRMPRSPAAERLALNALENDPALVRMEIEISKHSV